jgi:2-(1,2-epoxy-1,2-dihydrophenyl)acetyl-CoA isomerase
LLFLWLSLAFIRPTILLTTVAQMIGKDAMLTPLTLQVHLHQGVYSLVLNRPAQRNALDLPTLAELHAALEYAKNQTEIRCVVLSATGASFCAGADVKEWADAQAQGRLETYGWTQAAHATMVALESLPKPTLAVLQGSAVGAGLDLALCCDLRICASTARFRAGYTSMAYAPDAGSSWHLPRLIGQERAKRFLFLNESWDASQALQAGLVGEVLEAAALAERAQNIAAQLASGPTVAFAHTKALLQSSANNSLAEQLQAEQLAGLACGRSLDAQEALQASVEKRAPHFIGR